MLILAKLKEKVSNQLSIISIMTRSFHYRAEQQTTHCRKLETEKVCFKYLSHYTC